MKWGRLLLKFFLFIPYFIAPPALLFNEDFMRTYTKYTSWKEMNMDYQEEISIIWPLVLQVESEAWEQFVLNQTAFQSWADMREKAEQFYLSHHPYGPFY
ncbi:hypothetical protein [Alkalihalobacillus sp. 1P02AB]|uniref:hypothetical protein n=1 Tax=Alkalihalobacillus sp. 1P02AB TaxID=3132260 RepID=UPI0039A550DF